MAHTSDRQADKFREAARELETDQSEENFDRVVKKVAKASDEKKPADKQRASKSGD